jgi:hypothetical protein
MRGEPIELSCPFCDKGKIQCWYIPSTTSFRSRSTATFGKTTKRIKSPDIWMIKSGCPSCGKSAEEVEKEFKNRGII